MSSSQTLRLVGLLRKYVNETPTLGPKSRHLEALLQGIVDKLKSAVDNDVFIPINLKMYDVFIFKNFMQKKKKTIIKINFINKISEFFFLGMLKQREILQYFFKGSLLVRLNY